jgi:hypothetical protein
MDAEMSKEELEKVKLLILQIENNPYSYDFKEPVDFKGLGLIDYPDIIKHPMDLGTIKQKIETSKYKNTQEILADISLIWDNCKTYNRSDSGIYKMAEALEKFTKKTMLKLKIETKKAEDNMYSMSTELLSKTKRDLPKR